MTRQRCGRLSGAMARWALLAVLLSCAGKDPGVDAATTTDAMDAAAPTADAAPDEAMHAPLAAVLVRPSGERTLHHLDCALNRAGAGVAVWRETDFDFKSTVWASRFAGAWQPSERLGARPATQIEGPVAALDGEGRGLAVWNESEVMDAGVFAARLLPATGWAAPARISPRWILSLAGSAAGEAAAFGAGDAKSATLLRFTPSAGWADEVVRLDPEGSFFASPLGHGLLVWNQPAAGGREVYTSDSLGGAWAAPVRLQDARAFDNPLPILNAALAPDGSTILIWNRGGEVTGQLWGAGRSADGAWEPPHLLADGEAALWTTDVVAADGGGGVAVWETGDSPERKVWAALHDASGWRPAVRMGDRSEVTAAALGAGGSAVVAWASPGRLYGRHYDPVAGWGAVAAGLDTNAGVASLCAAVDGAGHGWLVWVGESPQVVHAAPLDD
jgi:hypothetical protein